jgi:hypothetical protein
MTSGGKRYPAKADLGAGQRQGYWSDLIAPVSVTEARTTNATVLPSILFERLPGDGFIGNVRRYLTVAPDGRVYWMRLLEDGLHIYRR